MVRMGWTVPLTTPCRSDSPTIWDSLQRRRAAMILSAKACRCEAIRAT
jgi:hypothetical protein